ncbi:MAG: hypothetical protein AB9907_16260 [Flexilinea sp.]
MFLKEPLGDLIETLEIDPAKVSAIYNPIDLNQIHKLMDEQVMMIGLPKK